MLHVCEKVANDLLLGSGSNRVLQFPQPLKTSQSGFSLDMTEGAKTEIPKPDFQIDYLKIH